MNRQAAKNAKDLKVVEPNAELDDLAQDVTGAAIDPPLGLLITFNVSVLALAALQRFRSCTNPMKPWRSWRLGGLFSPGMVHLFSDTALVQRNISVASKRPFHGSGEPNL